MVASLATTTPVRNRAQATLSSFVAVEECPAVPVDPPVEQKSCRRLVRLVTCAALFAGGVIGFAQEPPEAEDPKAGLKKPVLAPDGPEPKPRPGSGNTPDVRL